MTPEQVERREQIIFKRVHNPEYPVIKAERAGYTDDWCRPIAVGEDGSIYVDVNLGSGQEAWHTTSDEGEPDSPIQLDLDS